MKFFSSRVPAIWGRILGTLSNQTDLQTALNAKQNSLGFTPENVANKATDFSTVNNTLYPTIQAVNDRLTAYIAALDAVIFKGVIDCSANPNYPAADAGFLYRVSVAGKIGGASGPNVEVGDTLLCLTDGTTSGTQAGVGANWNISQNNIDGGVIGPVSSGDGNVALFNGTSGKVIKDSTFPIAQGDTVNTVPRRTSHGWIAAKRHYVNPESWTTGQTLTLDSSPVQILTGAGGVTHQLPSTSTMIAYGTDFLFLNKSAGAWTIHNSSGGTIFVIQPGLEAIFHAGSASVDDWSFSCALTPDPDSSLAAYSSSRVTTQKALKDALDLKEDVANKAIDLSSNDDTHYPTTQAVATALAAFGASSGNFTPTPSSSVNLNLDPTTLEARWTRIGNIVTVSGKFIANPTVPASGTSFFIDIPIATAAGDDQGDGVAGLINGTGSSSVGFGFKLRGDSIQFVWLSTFDNTETWAYTFSYQVV